MLSDLKDLKNILELFYHGIIEINPNNGEWIKDLEKTKVVLPTNSELCDKLIYIYIYCKY